MQSRPAGHGGCADEVWSESRFNLRVVGLDPKDSAADGAAMKAGQVGTNGPLAAHTAMLRGARESIATITEKLGFRATYDAAHDQFAHPAAVYVVTGDGRIGTYNLMVSRALAVGGGTTIAVLALLLGLMFRREQVARR